MFVVLGNYWAQSQIKNTKKPANTIISEKMTAIVFEILLFTEPLRILRLAPFLLNQET